MSVIVPWDRAYRRAKMVRQAQRPLSGRFDGFLADFEESFGVRPLWLETDHLDHTGEEVPNPRLEVVIERTKDYRKFLTAPYNFNVARQRKVAEVFARHPSAREMASMFKLPRNMPAGYDFAQRMFVAFAVSSLSQSRTPTGRSRRGRSQPSRRPSNLATRSGAPSGASEPRSSSSTPTPRPWRCR